MSSVNKIFIYKRLKLKCLINYSSTNLSMFIKNIITKKTMYIYIKKKISQMIIFYYLKISFNCSKTHNFETHYNI